MTTTEDHTTGTDVRSEPEGAAARLLRGAIAGSIAGIAGIAFAVITMWFTYATGGGWLAPLKLISTVVLGADALQAGTAQPWVGVAVHVVTSAALGMAFALVTPRLRTNGTVALAGTVYGALVYVVNFLVVAPLILPQFLKTNQPFELVIHIVFGTLLSFFFYSSGMRRDEPLLAIARH